MGLEFRYMKSEHALSQVSNLDQNLGLHKLTTVQQKALPVVLSGKDALIRSQTGSGKTLVYALPIVEALQAVRPKISRADGVQAIVVVPTRELALQTYEWFIKLVKVSACGICSRIALRVFCARFEVFVVIDWFD